MCCCFLNSVLCVNLDRGSAAVPHPLGNLCTIFTCTVWHESTFSSWISQTFQVTLLGLAAQFGLIRPPKKKKKETKNLLLSDNVSHICLGASFFLFFFLPERSDWQTHEADRSPPPLFRVVLLRKPCWPPWHSATCTHTHRATQTVRLADFIQLGHRAGDH